MSDRILNDQRHIFPTLYLLFTTFNDYDIFEALVFILLDRSVYLSMSLQSGDDELRVSRLWIYLVVGWMAGWIDGWMDEWMDGMSLHESSGDR